MSCNVLFSINRTTHSSKTLLCLVRFNVNKTLVGRVDPTLRIAVLFQFQLNYSFVRTNSVMFGKTHDTCFEGKIALCLEVHILRIVSEGHFSEYDK